jgi:flagellin
MSEAIKIIEAANTGIEKIEDLLNQMKSLASAAKTSDNVG